MKTIQKFLWGRQQRLKRWAIIGAVGLIYLLPFLTIPGLAAIYVKIEGLKGDVTSPPEYAEWIECTSLNWGVGRAISSSVGTSSDREASNPSISEVTVTKEFDSTSVPLFVEAAVGKGRKVEIHFVNSGADKSIAYYEMTLSDALISSFSQSSNGEEPSESVSINFTKIELKQTTGKTTSVGGYDLSTGKKL
jgi:type VI secretion system secreted protein Hcp